MHLHCQTLMSVHLGELSYKNHRITHSLKANLKVYLQKKMQKFWHLPTPITFSIFMQEASISLANSLTAWFGSSYVKGSTYVLTPARQKCFIWSHWSTCCWTQNIWDWSLNDIQQQRDCTIKMYSKPGMIDEGRKDLSIFSPQCNILKCKHLIFPNIDVRNQAFAN